MKFSRDSQIIWEAYACWTESNRVTPLINRHFRGLPHTYCLKLTASDLIQNPCLLWSSNDIYTALL